MLERKELTKQIKEKAKSAGILVNDSYLNEKTDEELEKFAKQIKVLVNKGKYNSNKNKISRLHANMQFNVSNGKIV